MTTNQHQKPSIKFMAHGIKTSHGLEKAWYMLSTLADGRRCITVCADSYSRFSSQIHESFAIENGSDLMADYFEKDSFRVFPEHPLFQEVTEGFRKMLSFRMKVSKNAEYARTTMEELSNLSKR